MNYYPLVKNLLFSFGQNTSWTHHCLIYLAQKYPYFAGQFFPKKGHVDFFNLKESAKYHLLVGDNIWTFPVGLGSGLDVNGNLLQFLSQFYFGALEIGPINPCLEQKNSCTHRFFERMGDNQSLKSLEIFNTQNIEKIKENIERYRKSLPIGINLTYKDLPSKKELSINGLIHSYEIMKDCADYFVINPMPYEQLKEFLQSITFQKPTFLKICPDLVHKEIIDLLHLVVDHSLCGVIATGATGVHPFGQGEITGTYLRDRAQSVQSFIFDILKNDKSIEVIGSGGISRFVDIWNFWKMGGRVVQLFSSFIYQGPNLLIKIKKEIDEILSYYHLQSVEQILQSIDSLHYPIPRKKVRRELLHQRL